MLLTRHETGRGPGWALDGSLLPSRFDLRLLLELPRTAVASFLASIVTSARADGALLPPIEPSCEVWAAGVTYERSRVAREEESSVKDVYAKVYEAERPELFMKSLGWRVAGHRMPIRVRADSRWNVPEPELTLVINAWGEIVGYTAGNDVSSREIEGENPLYLPQAKIYDGSCALGPGLVLADEAALVNLPIRLAVERGAHTVFQGETSTSRIKRALPELASWLFRELRFPEGAFLMTGTGIVPPGDFTMQPGDLVRVAIGELALENAVAF